MLLKGIIRRRRDLSKRLAFFDLQAEKKTKLPPGELCDDDAEEENGGITVLQLVCEWPKEVPKTVVSGLLVTAEGEWDVRGRFSVHPGKLFVEKDVRGDSPWDNASILRNIRKAQKPQCTSDEWEARSKSRREEKIANKMEIEDNDSMVMHDKGKHNIVFTKWLVDTFGLDKLRKGVCDVAGGRGLISLELTLNYDVPSVLIEPKPLRLNSSYRKRVKKWKKKLFEQNENIVSMESFNNNVHSLKASKGKDEIPCPISHIQEDYHGKNSSESIAHAVQNCGVVLAMHPDQVTGDVLEHALALNKPFAIVPCCVFSRLNPHRMTPQGNTVATYDEFCDWIQCQGDNILREKLPFHGRNIVLYRL